MGYFILLTDGVVTEYLSGDKWITITVYHFIYWLKKGFSGSFYVLSVEIWIHILLQGHF